MDRKRAWAIIAAIALVASVGTAASAADPPGPPTAPVALVAAGGDEQAVVSWIPGSDGGSPLLGYVLNLSISGVVIFSTYVPPEITGFTATANPWAYDGWAINWGDHVQVGLIPYNAYGQGGMALSGEFTITEGAPTPEVTLQSVTPAGGSVTTDPGGIGPTPAAPVTTTVAVPATVTGALVSIAESAVPMEHPTGFFLFGQQLLIESTAPTTATNPMTLTFRVDPSLVPVTVLHNGDPVETACAAPGLASPSPCIASGAGTATITILSATASTWSFAIRPYTFGGFSSPVDNRPVTNSAKPGSVIPVRFSLGGNQGLNALAAGYPKSGQVACDAAGPADAIEETVGSASPLSYHAGTGLYQYGWKTQASWGNTCREFVLKFRDGSEARATFKFR